mgnify:CR=1 FL=1
MGFIITSNEAKKLRKHVKLFNNSPLRIYLWTIGCLFLAGFLFFNFDYRYIDDYRIFIHNSTVEGFLSSHKWGFSRIIGNYFFGLLYLPQNNVFLNIAVLAAHVLNGLLIFRIMKRYGSTIAAFFTGLLFISIPITSEAFFWGIAGQVVYAATFFLLAVQHYLTHQEDLKLKNGALIVLLFALSVSFYEVFILFPFFFLLVTLWRRKNVVLSISLAVVSAGYLGTLKFFTQLLGGNITAQQKTTMIAINDIPERLVMIVKDLFHVFFGKVAWLMYSNSLSDAMRGAVPIELWVVLAFFLIGSVTALWLITKRDETQAKTESALVQDVTVQLTPFILAMLIGCALGALLALPVNYFHDLRTFYPFTLSLVLFIGVSLQLVSRFPLVYKLGLTVMAVLIVVNMIVLKVENNQYAQIYTYDWKFIQQLESDYKNGITTIIYLPGFNSERPLETQMNLAYYPESNFIYGTHMLTAVSIKFTRTPFKILGNRQEIMTYVAANPDAQRVYDFVRRETFPVSEFLSTEAVGEIDLTMLHPNQYHFQDVDHNLKKYDASVIQDRKLYKSFITHPNCSETPATLYVTTPKLTQTCETSFKILTVKDVERRTTSDGVEFKFYVNDALRETIHLKPDDVGQSQKLYTYSVEPGATGSAQLRFEVTDGGKRNCNDDKIFIAQPMLSCK